MRILSLFLLAPLLTACGDGPNPETLLTDLRVVAAVVDPPVIAPGEEAEVEITVADPDALGAEVAVWTCGSEGCTFDAGAPDEQGRFFTTVSPVGPAPLWVLACEPGLCDDLDDDALIDPSRYLSGLPPDRVSLASRLLRVTDALPEPPPANPEILEAPTDDALLATGEPLALSFRVPGAERAWGYTTAGGFARPSEDLTDDGEALLTWYPPEKGPQAATLYVVFEDGLGGTAVWQAQITEPRMP